MLTRRQAEKQLIREYRRTGSRHERDAMIERFLPLARSLARRYRRGVEPLEDLEQVASLALVRAVESFDPSRDAAFSSYAVPPSRVRSSATTATTAGRCASRATLQELAMRIQRFNEAASATTGESPSAAQVARQAGVSVEEVIEAREAYQALHADSMDQPRESSADEVGRASLLETIGTHDMAFGSASIACCLTRCSRRWTSGRR